MAIDLSAHNAEAYEATAQILQKTGKAAVIHPNHIILDEFAQRWNAGSVTITKKEPTAPQKSS